MINLSNLPNIGKKLEEQLNNIGITSAEELQSIGSKEAWLKIKSIDSSACINRLYALEGAIQGIRWHSLPKSTKDDLKSFFTESDLLK